METRDIAVTGMGLISPAGIGCEDNWHRLCEGNSLAVTDPRLIGLRTDFSCAVQDFRAENLLGHRLARRLDAFGQFAVVAARQAVADADLDPGQWRAERVGVVLGVGSNSLHTYEEPFRLLDQDRASHLSPFAIPRSVPSMAAGEVALDLGVRGVTFTTSSACASGATALGTAMDLLRSGRCDVVLAGGSESARSRMTAACFSRMGALSSRRIDPAAASRPFDADRDGFVLGEGAAVMVLERAQDAHRRRARVRGLLAGYGAGVDAFHPTAPDPRGCGAEATIRAALADAGCDASDIDHINAHGTSTLLNDEAEARLLRRIFPSAPPVTANKSVLGHALGAAGAIEAALTLLSLEHGVIPPTANLALQNSDLELDIVTKCPRPTHMTTALSTSFGFGGQNAVLVMRRD
ncbi:beta-ketoacyl synthase [Streptomyces sp. SID12501]|uniref:Beta-ketoacyl-[acyl-carrier-protein] synthase family protein n=1 Tax=Streptomyces sp. SID12501 TaxID=2706042 RepID=A0A6B3BQ05_9ACTN|nr:beta-ketoacyl-[acyl-carrier-protein] synthase family protein [Streptomyces sp. SID12501]NEC86406.1 beta-ketoacyl-[acyl-carrier-protein] synthase family protein [Streptomyces sp. SID12501]